ncbi:ATP-binding protein [Sulfurimonas sp.]|uniref:ATP-binding protein n=1 Tax=Sulfurimonas sp. TaxID=2022749 RepID=UPI002AB09B4B|nr:ATP-binding protein [Sulfurimonas sp.]
MSSGKVDTNIESIVNDLKTISWQQVLNEAITNSLQANATKIKIKFMQGALDLNDTKKYIDSIVVEDNGDGFNDINTKSFKEYKTQHKKEFGCKGIGRFFYLKVFDKVDIESLDKKINFIISQDINIQDNLKKVDITTVNFKEPKVKFVVDYDKYKDELNDHFLAYFKLLKDKKLSITIDVYENSIKQFDIKSDDIPKFETNKFKIGTYDFTLDYIINDDNIKNYDGFYCAGGRVVIKNSYLDSSKKFKFFKKVNILFLLSSNYFDNNVNETRDDFSIYRKQRNDDIFHNLSWTEIQTELKTQIKQIAKDNDIDIDKLSKESRKKALDDVPFLAYYLQNNDNYEDYETLKEMLKKC